MGYRDPVDDRRDLLERKATELNDRGALNAALAVLRQAGKVPPSSPEAVPRSAGLRMHMAARLRSAGRAREALALLDTVPFGPETGGALAGDALTEQLRTRFQRLRGLLCDDNGAYEQARVSFGQAIEAAVACGDLEARYQALTGLAASSRLWLASVQPPIAWVTSAPAISSGRVGRWPWSATALSHGTRGHTAPYSPASL